MVEEEGVDWSTCPTFRASCHLGHRGPDHFSGSSPSFPPPCGVCDFLSLRTAGPLGERPGGGVADGGLGRLPPPPPRPLYGRPRPLVRVVEKGELAIKPVLWFFFGYHCAKMFSHRSGSHCGLHFARTQRRGKCFPLVAGLRRPPKPFTQGFQCTVAESAELPFACRFHARSCRKGYSVEGTLPSPTI